MDYFFSIISNYLFIQSAILLFFAPFYLGHLYKYKKYDKTKLTISEHLEKFFVSQQANYLMMSWAALEAIIWFVIPEYLLLLLVFLRIKRKVQLVIYDIYGTILGTIIAFLLPIHSTTDILNIPYLQPNMIKQVQVWYEHLGIFGLFFQPFSGVPYKVFTLTAQSYHFFLPWFILLAVLVRISRYYFFYIIFTNIYPFLHRFVYKNYVPLFFIAGFLFTIALLKVYHFYDASYVIDYSFIKNYRWMIP